MIVNKGMPPVLLIIIGIVIGVVIYYIINQIKLSKQKEEAQKLLEKTQKDIEKQKREAAIEAKEEQHRLKIELDKEIKEKKNEVKEMENRLNQRESNLDKRDESLQKRESTLDELQMSLSDKQVKLQEEKSKMEDIKREQLEKLEQISGLSKQKAKDMIMEQVRESMNQEISEYIHERENEAKLEADTAAQELIVSSMQRYAADIASDQTVTVVDLPNDDMKGRLIGREGRNIRTIEAVTGVDLIIDDTPEAVVLSSFDPLRREIARQTLEALIKDGRIHPTRIEEIYDKICKDMKQKTIELGKEATYRLGLSNVDVGLVETIGKLHFRTSYGQNVLSHSIEVAELCGVLAGELGQDINLAKRAGLLHDIGKAVDHEIEGSHVEIGVDIAKKYKEDDVVINSIASHHGDTSATSIIATLVQIADTLSASRPGARSDSLENYINRLTQLESVATEIEGVEKSFAVQAGRELRVIVKPDEVDDLGAHKIARDVKEKIEKTMKYPGVIKVTVVRETRAEETAK